MAGSKDKAQEQREADKGTPSPSANQDPDADVAMESNESEVLGRDSAANDGLQTPPVGKENELTVPAMIGRRPDSNTTSSSVSVRNMSSASASSHAAHLRLEGGVLEATDGIAVATKPKNTPPMGACEVGREYV